MLMTTSRLFRNCLNVSNQKARQKSVQVTVCGAGGKIGQLLSLLLKKSKVIDQLVLYDIHHVTGITAELNHVDVRCKVQSESGDQQLGTALEKSDVVVVVANASKATQPNAMFNSNAGIVKNVAQTFAKVCPKATLVIATNPVNSLVPLASEILRANKVLDQKKVLGATSINVIRASSIVAETFGVPPQDVSVPVIGGFSESTVVPILSHTKPAAKFTNDQIECITQRVQSAHIDVTKLRYNKECGFLTCAYALAKLVMSVVNGLKGQQNIIEHAYVYSKVHPSVKYFTTPLLLGPNGVEKNFGLPQPMTEYETCQMQHAVSILMKDIQVGERYCDVEDPRPCDPCSPDQTPPCPPSWCQMI